METGTRDLPSTLPDDRNLSVQLPHHQESISQPSQILNEPNIYPETPPPTYDQALTYKLGVHQPFPPIPVINNNVQQLTAVNPPVPYALAHTNNAQATSMNCALVQEPPKPSSRIVVKSVQLTLVNLSIPYTCGYYNARKQLQKTMLTYKNHQHP